jgi:RNA polymerase sigma-70 factor (sigma-E family)
VTHSILSNRTVGSGIVVVMTFFETDPHSAAEAASEVLAVAVNDGRAAGFEALFTLEQAPMVRLAFLLLGSGPAAEEAVQEAFAKVYERWDRIDRPGAFLRACVVNECRSRHRRAAVARRKRHLVAEPDIVNDRHAELADALARLPQQRRTVVVLRHYLQMTTAEIANVMSISEGTVKSSLHRGLQQLKETLR